MTVPFMRRLFAAAAATVLTLAGQALAEEPTVIELTQTGCQFVEAENGVDHGYTPKSAEDCKAINATDGAERLSRAEVLTLQPGRYVFRVTNSDVPYTVGFWLREKGYDPSNPLDRLTRTSVSGGGLTTGTTNDYAVELEPGDYLYSCPLNPTPDYRIVVEN